MRWKGRAISGGISSPTPRNGSSRPRRTGRAAASRTSPTRPSSFRCRSKLFPLSLFVFSVTRMREPPPFSKVPAMTTMRASDLPLPRIGRGKVRDIYAVGDDRLLLLTTDRISAFDVVMAETIPMKGAVLTQISAWWFKQQLEGAVPHHMISADADAIIAQVPALRDHRAAIA